VVGGFVPPDVAAAGGGAGRGDSDAGLDSDLAGIGVHGNPGGLTGVRQAGPGFPPTVIASPLICDSAFPVPDLIIDLIASVTATEWLSIA
jgi:hypothetical protein